MPHSPGQAFEAAIRSRPAATYGAGLAILLAVLFFDPLFVGKTFVSRDLIPFFLPIEKAVHAAWRSGHVPLIIPEISFGRPLAANPNTGAFYPVRIAMALLPFPLAFKLFPIVHLWIAGMGCFLLARFLGASSCAAAIGGTAFALGGPALSEVMYPDFLPGLALMPFVILAAGRLVRRPTGGAASLFAAIWGLSLLVGDVFTSGLAFLGAVLLTIQSAGDGRTARSLGRLATATVPGILLAGIQLVPAMLFVPHTVRALGRFPLGAATMWSVSLWRFLEFILPFPFGNPAHAGTSWGDALWSGKSAGFANTLYPGILATLAIAGWRLRRGRRLLIGGLLFASVALAVPGFYLPKAWLGAGSPIPLRYPEKFMVGFSLAAALLLSGMADEILERAPARRLVRFAGIAGIACAFAALVVVLSPEATRVFALSHWTRSAVAAKAAADQLPRSLAIAAAGWLLAALVVAWSLRESRRRIVAVVLAGFVVLNLGARRFDFLTTGAEKDFLAPPPAAAAIRAVNEDSRYGFLPIQDYFFAATDPMDLATDAAATFGIPYAFNQDYDVADLYRVEVAREQIYRDQGYWKGLPGYLASFSARSAIIGAGKMPFGFSAAGPRFGSKWVVVNPSALPRVRFAGRVEEVEGPLEAYSAIHDRERDLSRVTVVESGRQAVSEGASGKIRSILSTANRLEVQTDTSAPARLILPLTFFPYRRFRLDASVVEAAATNLCLSSVAIPPGIHRLVVEEELPGGASGALMSVAGVLIVFLMGRRREAHAEVA